MTDITVRHLHHITGLHGILKPRERTAHDVHHRRGVREVHVQHDEGEGPGHRVHPKGFERRPYQTAVSESTLLCVCVCPSICMTKCVFDYVPVCVCV